MRKIVLIVLAITILLSLTACNKAQNSPSESTAANGGNTQPSSSETPTTTTSKNDVTEPDNMLNWGVTDQFSADNDKPAESFYINFPHFAGASQGYAMVADQSDGTVALISGQNDYAPEISGISELFPAYFDQLEYTLQKLYGLRAKNFELSLQDSKPTTVGEYEMQIFSGTISFEYEGEPRQYQFVSYATTLKSNGAYAYWVVYDNSADQSNSTLIAEHALNMAKTFREEQ